jgi:hypothetical protein
MLVLAVTTGLLNQAPTILLQDSDHLPDRERHGTPSLRDWAWTHCGIE